MCHAGAEGGDLAHGLSTGDDGQGRRRGTEATLEVEEIRRVDRRGEDIEQNLPGTGWHGLGKVRHLGHFEGGTEARNQHGFHPISLCRSLLR